MWNGAWHHVAGTYDGASVRLYVDGAQVGTGTPASGPIAYGLASSNRLAIGNYAGNLPDPPECSENTAFGADIDEVRVFNRALSQQEIGSVLTGVDPGRRRATTPAPACRPAAARARRRPRRGRRARRHRRVPRRGRPGPGGRRRRPHRRRLRGAAVRRAGAGRRRACGDEPSSRGACSSGSRRDGAPVPLAGVASLPVGAVVDARKGRLDLRAGRPPGPEPVGADRGRDLPDPPGPRPPRRRGRDRPRAADPARPGPRVCGGGRAAQGRRAPAHRRARASSGPSGAAAPRRARGATWAIADRCDGTLTRAIRGRVRCAPARRSVIVRPGSVLPRQGPPVRRQGAAPGRPLTYTRR